MEQGQLFKHQNIITDACPSIFNNFYIVGDKQGLVYIYNIANNPKLCGYFQNKDLDIPGNAKVHYKIRSLDSVFETQTTLGVIVGTLKDVRLWSISSRKCPQINKKKVQNSQFPISWQKQFKARQRQSYFLGGNYMLHSVSKLGLSDNFLSSDDLRIVLWNLEQSSKGCILVDFSPQQFLDLSEVITTMCGHCSKSHIFAWGGSRGNVSVGDLRLQLNCNHPSLQFQQNLRFNHYYEELISSIKSILFMQDDWYIVTRDYFNLKIWDTRQNQSPVKVIKTVTDIQLTLNDAFEQGLLNNEFNVSEFNNTIMTGDYGCVNMADLNSQQRIYVQQEPFSPIQRVSLLQNMFAYSFENNLVFKSITVNY